MGIDEPKIGPPERPGPRRPGERPRGGFGLRHLMVAIVGFALLFWMVAYTGFFIVAFLLTILPVALVVGTVVLAFQRWGTQREGLLWVLTVAARRGMPLGPGVEAYADLCSPGYRSRALVLARMMESGSSLPEALYRVPDVLPGEATLLAYVGWRSGTLGSALGDAVGRLSARQPFRQSLALRLGYLGGSLFLMQTIIAFFMYFIMPKFEAIFADFGVRLPRVTLAVIEVSHGFGAAPAMLLLYLLEFGGLVYLALLQFGVLSGNLPGLDLLAGRRHAATVLRALAAGAEGGRPITEGLATLARYYPSWLVRGRLAQVLQDVDGGEDWVRSLLLRRVIRRPDAAVIVAAQRVGNLPWALRELADGIDRRLDYRRLALIQALFPVIVLVLGALVFVMAVACFAPLITLVDELARCL